MIPVVMTPAGRTTQTPQELNTQLIDLVEAAVPGYTADLPGSLIEDVSSTDTYALLVCDQAVTETVNSLTPFGANQFVLNQLAQIYGVPQGQDTNTSVYVVFTGPAGYVLAAGFTVSDGTYQYVVQDGGVILTGGQSEPLYAIATQAGTWAVPAGTVTQLVTSVPSTIALTVTNPLAGTPSGTVQTIDDFRGQVLEAGLVSAQGMPRMLKTLLRAVPGVQANLVSVKQTSEGWEVICGGGDPYAIANAIFSAVFDINVLVGSTMAVTGITQANPGVVTTLLNHGLPTGQVINIAGIVGMTELNNTPLTITVLTEKTFSIGVDTSAYTAYVSGGVVTPNYRNVVVTIQDFPDIYDVPFVLPPQQTVTMTVLWNSTLTNAISDSAIAQLAAPALIGYVNALPVGAPMNQFVINSIFQNAIVSVIPQEFLTRMVFSVYINGLLTTPETGTGIIAGDPESYFYASPTSMTISQG